MATEYAFEGGTRNSTAISWSVATQTFPSDASTPFSNVLPAFVVPTITAAFARWSSVSGLVFTQVADAISVPIRIGFGTFSQFGELGETDYRISRGILADDTLIRLLDPASAPILIGNSGALYYPFFNVTLYQVVLHEIGHALGLDHSTDPLTSMYPYATAANADLAEGDAWGINALYPLLSVSALNPAQAEGGAGQADSFDFLVTRYSDPGVSLSINYAVTGAATASLTGSAPADPSAFAGGAFPSGQLTFAAGSTTALLSISTIGNTVPQPDEGFALTFSTGSATNLLTVRGTTTALILDDDGYGQVTGGTVGVYRFFDTVGGTHFYSTDQSERNTLIMTRPDLVYEGRSLTALASPSSDPTAAPIFRFFDTRNGTHFYSASTAERDAVVATRPDLVAEGVAFYEHASAQAGDQPVFRFFDSTNGSHLYTSSASERDAVAASRPDLRAEGIAFYAPST